MMATTLVERGYISHYCSMHAYAGEKPLFFRFFQGDGTGPHDGAGCTTRFSPALILYTSTG
jgi:hypothetical protein